MKATPEQVSAYIELVKIIYELVSAAGGKPSGEVYALTMQVFPNVDTYNAVIDTMCRSGLIRRESNHLLVANPLPSAQVAP